MIRDQALELSGLLTRKVGGESSRPYQPEGYYNQLNFLKNLSSRPGFQAIQERTLHPLAAFFYTPCSRHSMPPTGRSARLRDPAQTLLQSLNLLNDPSFVEAAEHLADRILENQSGDDRTRIAAAFEKVTLEGRTIKN